MLDPTYKEVRYMSSGVSFWKRVGSAFRANADGDNGDGNGVTPTIERTADEGASGRDAESVSSSGLARWPWNRWGRSYRQLDARYQRVVELLDLMGVHFERQDQRSTELAAGVDRLGSTLEQLAGAQRTQSECVASIAARVDEAARHSAALSTVIREMPAALQAQAQAVRAISQQMEAARDADAQLVSSLHQFGRAADALRDAGSVQTAALQRLHHASEEQADSLQAFVRSQTRLLLIITVVVAVLGLGAISALAVVVRMVFNQ
jgi:hypothetical protein